MKQFLIIKIKNSLIHNFVINNFKFFKLNNEDQSHHNEESRESLYSSNSKQNNKQKKRSKGQRLDNQLLGFTVQPDPNLKNRGDIEQL